MTLTDKRGVPVSTRNRAALDHLEQAIELFHGYYLDPFAALDRAFAEDPGCIVAHCFRAGAMAMAAERAALPALKESVEAVEARWSRANERERGHITAARAWLEGEFERAVQLYGDVVIRYPRDSLAVQLAHLGDFYLGQSTMLRDRIAQVLPHWSESDPGFGYVLGMHAFGLEETNDFARAEEFGRRALSLEAKDPWTVHAVAHVMEMQGRLGDGTRWLEDRTPDWAPENMFAFHNWWHLALYYLDLGRIDRVLQIYDEFIRPQPSQVALEMVDASALLWRLTIQGHGVGPRWNELADTWERIADTGFYAFNDAHAMMAYVGAGRETAAMSLLGSLRERATEDGTNAMMTREVGLPLAQALYAYGHGDYHAAATILMRIRGHANRIGGSNAQRDVIGMTLVEAALRTGDAALARAAAAERTAFKPASPYNWRMLAKALDLASDSAGAADAAHRANALVREMGPSRHRRAA